jgi:hypothetical protein
MDMDSNLHVSNTPVPDLLTRKIAELVSSVSARQISRFFRASFPGSPSRQTLF